MTTKSDISFPGRVCCHCSSTKTLVELKRSGIGYYERWYRSSTTSGKWECQKCYKRLRRTSTLSDRRLKHETFVHYFGESYKCLRCGTNDVRVLQMHHANGGGNKHRIQIFRDGNRTGTRFYRWLRANNYPKIDFKPYCANCHIIIEIEFRDSKHIPATNGSTHRT